MNLLVIADRLSRRLARADLGPAGLHVYYPLRYARAPYVQYIDRYAGRGAAALLLGMNPGPWGMVQTGVPFGEVRAVRDWLKIEAPIGRPRNEHPKRPVLGWDCRRSEVSGARLWGWARDRFGTPRRFFRRFFVANYCPLAFLETSGANLTPDKLPVCRREPLFAACDEALRQTVDHLRPTYVVGVGAFAEARARIALAGMDVAIGRILHPSPASPAANRGWAFQATAQLTKLGIRIP